MGIPMAAEAVTEYEQAIKSRGSTHLTVALVLSSWRLAGWIAKTLRMLETEDAACLNTARTLRANRARPEGNCPSSRVRLALSSPTWRCTMMASTMLMTVVLMTWIPRWKRPMRITLSKKLRASERASRLGMN